MRPITPAVEPTQRRADRDLKRQDLPAILGSLGVIAALILLTALGHPFYGAAVFGGAMLFAFRAMPREQREAIGRELERRERRPVGRVLKVLELLGALLVLYFILHALLNRQ